MTSPRRRFSALRRSARALARLFAPRLGLVLIAAAALLGWLVPQPARFLVDHHALEIALALLVFTTAVAVPMSAFRGLRANAGRLIATLTATTLVLPILSWAVSSIVPSLALRRGVLTIGLAPTEIASVTTTALASGSAPVAAGLLLGTTLVTVAFAGIGIRIFGGGGAVHPVHLLINLSLVVGVPMAAGMLWRMEVPLSDRQQAAAEHFSIAVLTVLVWLVASQVRLSSSYVAVTAALVLFLCGSAALGALLGFRSTSAVATALLLTTSMRDFAIAADIAVTAFGPQAAGPLGLYGVLVIAWGMVVAARRSASHG